MFWLVLKAVFGIGCAVGRLCGLFRDDPYVRNKERSNEVYKKLEDGIGLATKIRSLQLSLQSYFSFIDHTMIVVLVSFLKILLYFLFIVVFYLYIYMIHLSLPLQFVGLTVGQ